METYNLTELDRKLQESLLALGNKFNHAVSALIDVGDDEKKFAKVRAIWNEIKELAATAPEHLKEIQL